MPRHIKGQFAGSMGVVSAGPGWSYWKERLETDIMFGYLPKHSDRRPKLVITLKQNYMPWQKHYGDKWVFEPLTCGIYINTIIDNRFWMVEPSKYPKDYYKFSSKMHFFIFAGQRMTMKMSNKKGRNRSLTAYYEISTCDLYFISKVPNKYLKTYDYLSISFGLKARIF